jgi:hypothetical protein
MSDETTTPELRAKVRVGKGFRPITQNGRLTIAPGSGLTLAHGDGRIIAKAP